MYCDTTSLEKIQAMNARINIIQGGARAGKTTALLINICDLSFAVQDKIISIVTDTMPNLKKGAMRDWEKMLKATKRNSFFSQNKTDHIWVNKVTGTIIEFFSCEADDALGAERDYLFINEAWRIPYATFDQLMLRTKVMAWLDFNPVNEFWVHTEVMKKRTDWQFEKLTYLDNEAIPQGVLEDLLQHRGDGTSNWWRVYGLGEVGSLEGNVYSGWIPMEGAEIQKRGRLVRYGLDFGFSNDQTGMLAIYQMEEENAIGVIELLYRTNIRGSQYGGVLREIGVDPSELIVGDGARPEIIADIKSEGFRCIAANKNAGSVLRGIDRVASKKIYYCGKNLEREYLTYQWCKKKSTGEMLDEPQDGKDHLMDALRYAIDDLERPKFDF